MEKNPRKGKNLEVTHISLLCSHRSPLLQVMTTGQDRVHQQRAGPHGWKGSLMVKWCLPETDLQPLLTLVSRSFQSSDFCSFWSFIHRYLLNACCVPGTVLVEGMR